MAFNKLRVFNLTQYRKLLWMDADTLVLKNVDHLLLEPMFTASFTYACCNENGPAVPSGGLWVVEPSHAVAQQLQTLIEGPVPGTGGDVWHWGDMQVVRYLFGQPPNPKVVEPFFPVVEDGRLGIVPGARLFPEYAHYSDKQWGDFVRARAPASHGFDINLVPGRWDVSAAACFAAVSWEAGAGERERRPLFALPMRCR